MRSVTASDIGLVLLFVVLFAAAGVLAVAEVAILRVQRAQAVVARDRGERGARRLLDLIDELPQVLGTVLLVVVALLASIPLGVAAAIYLSEYAPDNGFTRAINLAIINLAGVPSIVHALFGVGAFVIFFKFGTSILAASLTLAIMTLPVVIVATRESLQAVPMAFREACWNMGATRWQTIRRVVLPNAVTGILTGVILEVSRTAGETAPIMFTGAAFFLPLLPQGVFDQTMALSLHLFVVSTQVPGIPEALPFGVALVLISMVLLMNSFSIALRMYLRGKKKW